VGTNEKVKGILGQELLRLPIRHGGIDLGRPVDLVLDLHAGSVVGVEVRCRDETSRFLPLAAARLTAEELDVPSPLTLLDDLAFYRDRGRVLRTIRNAPVHQGGRMLGRLRDVVVDPDGRVASLVVSGGGGSVTVDFDATIRVQPDRPRAPAA
jgi:sporulation protein YlmC with PRC-barrel domain